jgi:hypothetical protein
MTRPRHVGRTTLVLVGVCSAAGAYLANIAERRGFLLVAVVSLSFMVISGVVGAYSLRRAPDPRRSRD